MTLAQKHPRLFSDARCLHFPPFCVTKRFNQKQHGGGKSLAYAPIIKRSQSRNLEAATEAQAMAAHGSLTCYSHVTPWFTKPRHGVAYSGQQEIKKMPLETCL